MNAFIYLGQRRVIGLWDNKSLLVMGNENDSNNGLYM